MNEWMNHEWVNAMKNDLIFTIAFSSERFQVIFAYFWDFQLERDRPTNRPTNQPTDRQTELVIEVLWRT